MTQLHVNTDLHKKVWQRLLPGVVVIAIVVVFFVMFMINNNKRVTMQNESYVTNAAEQTASRIADNLYTAVRTLSNISEICTPDADNSYPEDLRRIDDSIFSIIDYVAVDESKTVTQNGNTYYYGTLYGFRGESEEPNYTRKMTTDPNAGDDYLYSQSFVRGMQMGAGEAGMLEEFYNITGVESSMMSFYTALHDANGKALGVIIGRYDEENIKNILKATFFKEPAGVFLCNGEGVIMTTTDESLTASGADNGDKGNILDLLKGMVAEDTLKGIASSFKNDDFKYAFSYSSPSGTVNACFTQLPLKEGLSADHWIILETFPATVTVRMQSLANLQGLQLGLGLIFALAIYIGLILLLGYFQNKKLVKANIEMTYVVDGLAKLYDRFIYVNLNERKYQYIGDTYPEDCDIPREGDYDDFKAVVISTFLDEYDREYLGSRLGIEEIKADLSDGTAQLRYEYRTDDGKGRWDDLSLICLSRDENGAKEVLFARQNISELKEKELHNQLVLREAFRAAEDANRAKSDFLFNMSHDIRTPMNAVLGFSALIEQSVDKPDKVAEYNKKIQSAGQHLIDLINDLLDMSKIESGKFTLNPSKFSMSGLLDEISSVMATQARNREQSYDLNTLGLIHDVYLGDRLRISQILINLISNAIKYTPEGGRIKVTVREGESFSDNITDIVFIVEDNGIGMSGEFLKKIYQPFEREERPLARKVQGTGLGMAITKNLIDLMGGTISVRSEENVGSTFTVVLHLVTVEQTDHSTSAISAEEDVNPLEGMSILIAEDNEINAEIICELLEFSGAKCELAENGSIAVQMFERSAPGKYDMVFMDVQMPVMNGYAATRAIRASAHPEAQTIPIVAMTANAFAEDVTNALNSGMNAHLAKPVSLDAVKATVAQLIRKNK